MKNVKIKDLLQAFACILQSLLTASYLGAYRYYTLEPIERIERCQEQISTGKLKVLVDFRHAKDEELSFVAKAAALSGAAALAVFSWPNTDRTIWAAKTLWNWSFFMSTFSLVGSAPIRLLQQLPDRDDAKYNDQNIQIALNLFLQPKAEVAGSIGKTEHRRMSRRMLWVWQCPAMLMSYSWTFFLVGYALHILSPVFDSSQAEVSSKVAIVTICGCALLVFNFAFCACICQYRLQKGTLREWIKDLLSGNKDIDVEVKDYPSC